MNDTQTVLFWRDERWHVGWVMDDREGSYRVGWVENNKVYTKVVSKVVPISVSPAIVQNRGI